jgi:uncharacterized protein YbjQ (UPF0145 family)
MKLNFRIIGKIGFLIIFIMSLFFLLIGCVAMPTTSTTDPIDITKVDYSDYIGPPAIVNYEIKGVVFFTATRNGKINAFGDTVWTGDGVTYHNIMEEAIKIGANGIINIVVDTEDKKDGSTYTQKQTATALAIKYISDRDK